MTDGGRIVFTRVKQQYLSAPPSNGRCAHHQGGLRDGKQWVAARSSAPGTSQSLSSSLQSSGCRGPLPVKPSQHLHAKKHTTPKPNQPTTSNTTFLTRKTSIGLAGL